jgi:hypothetical protein
VSANRAAFRSRRGNEAEIALNPKTEVESRHARSARPSGRFNVRLSSGPNTRQTMLTVKRPEGRAPSIRDHGLVLFNSAVRLKIESASLLQFMAPIRDRILEVFAFHAGQTFVSAGLGNFPVACLQPTGMESPVNRQAEKPALQVVGEGWCCWVAMFMGVPDQWSWPA